MRNEENNSRLKYHLILLIFTAYRIKNGTKLKDNLEEMKKFIHKKTVNSLRLSFMEWSGKRGSNLRPPAWE